MQQKAEIYETHSPEETRQLGVQLGRAAQPGEVYAFIGDLGVGKTVLVQGIAQGLGVDEPVCSPTFTIMQVYEDGRIPLYHFDVYRIGDAEEMEEIGCEEFFYGNGLCVVEWADLIREILPPDAWWIHIGKDLNKGYDYRQITVTRNGG